MLKPWLKKNLSFVFLTIFCWSLPFAWIFAIPKELALLGGREASLQRLQLMNQNVNHFAREFKRAPRNLNEIRLFSKANQGIFHAYDGYGHIIEYIPLDQGNYLIRSFGEDEIEFKKGAEPDFILSNLLKETPRGIKALKNEKSTHIGAYNPAVLQGNLSPDGHWHARVYVNTDTGSRRLVLRDRRDNNAIMVSLHDRVEEFFWRDNSDAIIFSASGSHLYKDGIYEWSLSDGRAINLFDGQLAKFDMHGLTSSKNFLISLAGYNRKSQTIYAFLAIDEGQAISPDLFYSDKALVGVSLLKNDQEEFAIDTPNFNATTFNDFLGQSYKQWNQVDKKNISILQKGLLDLPVRGKLDEILNQWTDFTAKQKSNAALFPYLNLHLAIWYSFAAKNASNRESDILRSFGAEFSRTLALDTNAPRYLQAISGYIHRRLVSNETLPQLIEQIKLN